MSTPPQETPDRECRPGLWSRVRDWFARWTAVFSAEEILRDGLSRRFALRCCNWLWPLEATVRRLIIAAALAVSPARLAPISPQRASRKLEERPPHGPAGFRIVSILGAGVVQPVARAAGAAAAPVRHLPFPSDDLLRLGAPRSSGQRKIMVRHDNPLCRSRVRRTDPDYAPASEDDYANSSERLFGSRKDRETSPQRGPGARDRLHVRVPVQSEDSQWRRIEAEWERVLPAPQIAARIIALARVLDSPAPYVHRLARRLAVDAGLAALLRDAPPPLLRKPKHDYFGPQVDEDLAMLAYAETQPPDTS